MAVLEAIDEISPLTPPALMRAATVSAPGRVEIGAAPVPRPGPREVLLRIERCGVCASNLAVWEGQPWFTYPQEPGGLGHEATGHIAAFGQEVEGWRIGQHVATLSYHAYAEYDVAAADALVALPPA